MTGCIPRGLQSVERNDIPWLGLPFCPRDQVALVGLYRSTGGPNWSKNRNWLSDAPMGEWYGVTTNKSGYVIEIDLSENELRGGIPSELGTLTNLRVLSLRDNQLSGDIPSELGHLSNLMELNLLRNGLSGEVPPELGSLSNLTILDLSDNDLSGEVPSELGKIRNLTHLYLRGNQLSGEIPTWLGSLTDLTGLDLSGNQLSGEIPSELGSLTKLMYLHLRINQLSGEIPPELGSLARLTPNPPKDTDGRREDSGRVGEGATGEMAGLIGVDWRSANGLPSPPCAPMALCGSCDARDGERIRSRELSRTGVARVCREVGSVAGWQFRRGVEWLAAGPWRE